MVRAPCCAKMGLKKGPWTKEEDQILIAYIKDHGHDNWRALPKQSGLLRCGKSCRLRWTNYLRPDIKRGNFSREEEENIIKLHELLGNRWSAIAARLPGRTDNEIKNVWHTHLKKRLKQNPTTADSRSSSVERAECNAYVERDSEPTNFSSHQTFENPANIPSTPQSTSDVSSPATYSTNSTDDNLSMAFNDENLWSGELSVENHSMPEFYEANSYDLGLQFPFSPSHSGEPVCSSGGPYEDESMNFWFNVYMGDGQWPELPEF